MRLAWGTDLHLNACHRSALRRWCERVVASGVEAVLLGGDLAESTDVCGCLAEIADRVARPVYFVLGNHDYYGSSIADLRTRVRTLDRTTLHWLPDTGCVSLTDSTALVGHGGWGDAGVGDFDHAPIMTCFLAIEELAGRFAREDLLDGFRHREPLRRILRTLGQECADTLGPQLREAVRDHQEVIVLTHVPPFELAPSSQPSDDGQDWRPVLVCKALGDLLSAVAVSTLGVRFRVLSGHVHHESDVVIAPNLQIRTRTIRYGKPDHVVVDVD